MAVMHAPQAAFSVSPPTSGKSLKVVSFAGVHTGFLVGGELGGPLKPHPPDLTPAK